MLQKDPKLAETKTDAAINPQNYNFNPFKRQTFIISPNATTQTTLTKVASPLHVLPVFYRIEALFYKCEIIV